jgi:hypothetical protein
MVRLDFRMGNIILRAVEKILLHTRRVAGENDLFIKRSGKQIMSSSDLNNGKSQGFFQGLWASLFTSGTANPSPTPIPPQATQPIAEQPPAAPGVETT